MLQAADRCYVVLDDRKNKSLQQLIQSASSTNSANLFQLSLGDSPSMEEYHHGVRIGSLSALADELNSAAIHSVRSYDSVASARVLAAQTRRADLSGPALQDVHYKVGVFLGNRLMDTFPHFFLSSSTSFVHVNGNSFEGAIPSRKVLILPLMRGGEPMARGVYACFPHAKFVHFWDNNARTKDDVETQLGSVDDVVFVDSVINGGASSRSVLQWMEDRMASRGANHLRLYFLAGVIQHQTATVLPKEFPRVRFLALRVSSNKYQGKGGTDTGNRLFGIL